MPMLDLSQFGLPTMPNGMLSPIPGQFDQPPPVDEAAAAQAAREAAAQRLAAAQQRPVPPMPSVPPADTFGMPGGPMPFGSLAPQTEAPAAPTLPPWLSEMASAGPSKAGLPASPMAPPIDPAALPPNSMPTSQLPLPDNVGPRGPLTPPGAPLDIMPQPAMAAPAAAPAAAAPGSASLLDRLSAASSNLGARPGLPGIFDAITGATTGQRMDPLGRQLAAENQTVAALVKKGIEPDMASAISKNPTLLQQIVPQLFGPKKYEHVLMKDWAGNDIPLSFDSSTGKYIGAGGQNSSLIGGGSPGATGAPGGLSGIPGPKLFAKGVTEIDHDLQGHAYLNQFSPEVQSSVHNYLDGKTLTTGNARPGEAQTIKKIAQKVGPEIGKPADDIAINGRREMTTQLSKGTPGSLGGQLTFGGTSLGHLAEVADKATRMNNVSGFGIAPLASVLNSARGLTTEQAAKVNEVDGAVQHYGQEITKFYTGSPGGEAERMRFLKTIGTSKSPLEIAGAIRTERDLIPDRLHQVEAQITERLGPEEAAKQMKRVDIAGVTEKINRSLAKLDPTGPEAKMFAGQPPAAGQAPAAAPAPGKYVYDPATNKLVPQ